MLCLNCGSRAPEGAVFCMDCGAKLGGAGAALCSNCGTEIPQDALFCVHCGAAARSGAENPPEGHGVPPRQDADAQRRQLIGFSKYAQHPEILAAAKGNKKASLIFVWGLALAALIGFPAAGWIREDFPFGEALIIGGLLFLLAILIGVYALCRAKRPVWEGTVVNRYSRERREHRGEDYAHSYTEYTTVIRTDAGEKKTIVEKDSRRYMYDYLAIGDRVRYHPSFSTYEKYDKSHDRMIYCNVCAMRNPIEHERCKRCHNLLFK